MERETQLAHARLPAVERGTIHPFRDGQPGPVSMQLREHLVGIQTGQEADTHGWMHRLD